MKGNIKVLSVDDGAGIAAIYSRVSTRLQGEKGTSLETQDAASVARAEGLGYRVPERCKLRDIASCADLNRPGLAELYRLVANREVQCVVVYETDRLARDPIEVVKFGRHCIEHGVLLDFVTGRSFETVYDELIHFVAGAIGMEERRLITERTMRGKRAVAESGKMPCGNGKGMYGYDYDPVTGVRTINEAEAAVVRIMYESRAAKTPVLLIAKRLNQKGILTKTGCQFAARTVRSILTNDGYKGEQYYGKFRHQLVNGKRFTIPVPREEWIHVPNFSPAIVDPTLFDLVQSTWAGPQPVGDKEGRLFLFTGSIWCAVCGCPRTGITQKEIYYYYRCAGTLGTEFRDAICQVGSVRADELEPVVKEHIRELLKNPAVVLENLRDFRDTGSGVLGRQIERLKHDISKCRSEIRTMVIQRTKDVIDQAMLEELVAPVRVLEESHTKQLAALEAQRQIHDADEQVEQQLKALFDRYHERLDNLSSDQWQTLLGLLQIRIEATQNHALVTGVIDPSLITIAHTLASTADYSYTLPVKAAKVRWPKNNLGRPRSKKVSRHKKR